MSLAHSVQPRLPMGAIRTVPLEGETTASWIARCAARYHLPPSTYLGAVLQQEGRAAVSGRSGKGTELYLNTPSRERLAAYSRIDEQVLARLLPAWTIDLDALRHHSCPASHWQSPTAHDAAPVMAGCLKCTAPRSVGRQVWQYRAWHQRVCRLHRVWLVGGEPGYTGPSQIPLDHLGETGAAQVLAAHRHHQALATHHDNTEVAYAWARGIIQHLYTDQELSSQAGPMLWKTRLRALGRQKGKDSTTWPWDIIARDLVTYPETLALASALTTVAGRQHAAAEQHFTAALTDTLRTSSGPGPAGEVEPLARWLSLNCREELQRWLNSSAGDEKAVPLHVPALTWIFARMEANHSSPRTVHGSESPRPHPVG